VFILAYRIGEGLEGFFGHNDASDQSRRFTAESNRSTGSRSLCVWPSRPRQPQHGWEPPRVVGDEEHFLKALGWELGDTGGEESSRLPSGAGRKEMAEAGQSGYGQAQPALGGDAHGPAGGLGYAELCVTCDNRTDELRLLGNGVVPATAERAFLTLIEQLQNQ
jgi:hypothetical protein